MRYGTILKLKVKHYLYSLYVEYIATKPFTEELFHTDDAGSTDFINTFQSVIRFYNEITLLKSHAKLEVSSNNARYNKTCHKEYTKYLLHLLFILVALMTQRWMEMFLLIRQRTILYRS